MCIDLRNSVTNCGFQVQKKEAISKLLKIVKAPSLRSDKGSVFGCYLAGSSLKLPFTALCE